uniref:Uncharacterized protein n=1 Tax=Leptobrachium leishanense TaxID=445787 RepID=A0A8C5QST9_9ANUR
MALSFCWRTKVARYYHPRSSYDRRQRGFGSLCISATATMADKEEFCGLDQPLLGGRERQMLRNNAKVGPYSFRLLDALIYSKRP